MSELNRSRKNNVEDVDVSQVDRSLCEVNNFTNTQRTADKQPNVLMYEITSHGDSQYKEMTLRELLKYVNDEATKIDEVATERDAKQAREQEDQTSGVKGISYMQDDTFDAEDRDTFNAVDGVSSKSSYGGEGVTTSAVTELRLRDLRRLDFHFNPNEEKTIIIRRHAVLFAMDPMRAVVMADRLVLIVPPGADSLLTILDKHMKGEETQPINIVTHNSLLVSQSGKQIMTRKNPRTVVLTATPTITVIIATSRRLSRCHSSPTHTRRC